jgi:hypothetical protein
VVVLWWYCGGVVIVRCCFCEELFFVRLLCVALHVVWCGCCAVWDDGGPLRPEQPNTAFQLTLPRKNNHDQKGYSCPERLTTSREVDHAQRS